MIPWAWPAPPDDGAAKHLTKGTRLPELALPTTAGRTITLSSLPQRTIVFAYPWTGRPGLANPPGWDDIPGAHGSTPEAEGFRNLYSAFKDLDADVFGLSTQSTGWQHELVARLELPFEIISDEHQVLTRALSLPTFEIAGVTYLKRLTLVIRDGAIEETFYPAHPPDAHPRDVLAWLTDHVGYALEARLRPAAPTR